MTKPTSKIIQISNVSVIQDRFMGIALCEDGSIWQRYSHHSTGRMLWYCILEAPTQPKTDLPEVGSRWRGQSYFGDYEATIDEVIKINGEYYVRFNGSEEPHEELLKDFLENYKPIPTESDNKE